MINLKDKVLVSDPCYKLGVWCTHTLTGVKPGRYEHQVKYWNDSDPFFNNRISELGVVEESYQNDYEYLNWQYVSDSIGVDSGQCGIYDYESVKDIIGSGEYDDTSTFYGKACQCTHDNNKQYNEYDSFAIISRSGCGDGCYALYVAKNLDDEIIAIKVVFLSDNEMEEEDED